MGSSMTAVLAGEVTTRVADRWEWNTPADQLAGLDFGAELRGIRAALGLPEHMSDEVGRRVAAILYSRRRSGLDLRAGKAA